MVSRRLLEKGRKIRPGVIACYHQRVLGENALQWMDLSRHCDEPIAVSKGKTLGNRPLVRDHVPTVDEGTPQTPRSP